MFVSGTTRDLFTLKPNRLLTLSIVEKPNVPFDLNKIIVFCFAFLFSFRISIFEVIINYTTRVCDVYI